MQEYFKTNQPDAIAQLKGSPMAPNLNGTVYFYQLKDGVYVVAFVEGMPITLPNGQPSGFHGFHIHEKGNCAVGDPMKPYESCGGHFNPTNQPHPFHAGDLPPLLSNNHNASGSAMLSVMTNRFRLDDVIGRSVVIHQDPDDFHTQPSGNSGPRWAAGEIRKA